jgi:hypothetical protein
MANTAVKTEIIPHPNPLTYALDHDSAEKAVLNLGAVQPSIGLRNRGVDDGHSLKQQEGNVQQPSETIEIRLESQIQEGNGNETYGKFLDFVVLKLARIDRC